MVIDLLVPHQLSRSMATALARVFQGNGHWRSMASAVG
jgi:hypothetical protein